MSLKFFIHLPFYPPHFLFTNSFIFLTTFSGFVFLGPDILRLFDVPFLSCLLTSNELPLHICQNFIPSYIFSSHSGTVCEMVCLGICSCVLSFEHSCYNRSAKTKDISLLQGYIPFLSLFIPFSLSV